MAEKTARAKGEFLANMSHEIRTPLNAIVGFTNRALKKEMNQKQHENLEIIKSSSDHLLGIINSILDYSKIEAGKLELESKAFDLQKVMKTIKDMFLNMVTKKGIKLHFLVDDDVPNVLIGDSLRIKQILINLINNAFKFTDKGYIEVSVKCDEMGVDGLRLKISVKDTGVGIPRDKLSNLFKAYGQADSSTTRKYGGTGLGLTISKEHIELMGGSIDVESMEGMGTVFHFTINVAYQAEGASVGDILDKELKEREDGAVFPAGTRILLAEDNVINQQLAVDILQDMGLTVDCVDNGEKAVFAVKKTPYKAVLMDVQMPVMDGLKATQEIKKNPKHKALPIIAMTANASQEDREVCLQHGMSDHLAKPIDEDQLYSVLYKQMDVAPSPETGDTIQESRAVVMSDDNIPDQFPGLDVKGFLRRIKGKKDLLLKLLLKFKKQYSDMPEKIEAAMIDKDYDLGHKLAHSIKGTAANLSATKMTDTADKLEYAFQDPANADISRLFNNFRDAFNEVMESIQVLEGIPPANEATLIAEESFNPENERIYLDKQTNSLETNKDNPRKYVKYLDQPPIDPTAS